MSTSPSAARRRTVGITGLAAQHAVDDVRDVFVDGDVAPVLDLDHDVEGRRRLALQDRLLGAAAARLFVARA